MTVGADVLFDPKTTMNYAAGASPRQSRSRHTSARRLPASTFERAAGVPKHRQSLSILRPCRSLRPRNGIWHRDLKYRATRA